ncbi:conjugal transfer protein TraF [Rickettsia tamurae]|uniref:conjugal transfer protein TraF n=1 Tax=Rickettsia tamurae TaxID=334545 RepID=UPI00068E769E|nr:conjugal transfer protein TraF [Rickettsia tamurae]
MIIRTSITINILKIIIALLLINHWSKQSFAGTITSDINNVHKMTEVNLNNNIWQQPQGFLWYNDQQVEETNKLPSHDASSLLHLKQESYNEPYDQRIKDLKQKFNRAQRQALDNPTLTNVIIAQRLHKQILDKSHQFATMWHLASLLDYRLTNIHEPANSLHKRLYEIRQDTENSEKLRFLAKNWGLILQVNQDCNYCHAFSPIVREFADKYGFQLLLVSNNGENFTNLRTIKDTGLLNKLNPAHFIPVLYLVASRGTQIYPVARGIISEDKISENILAVVRLYSSAIHD